MGSCNGQVCRLDHYAHKSFRLRLVRVHLWTPSAHPNLPSALCHAVLRSLEEGRGEDVPVLVLVGRNGGEGKSFFLSPLQVMFGHEHVQQTPQRGNFPLYGIESKKVALLDEWRFDGDVLPMAQQLLWYCGLPCISDITWLDSRRRRAASLSKLCLRAALTT